MTESAEEALRESRESWRDDGRFHNMSKSSGDSNFIQIQIPPDCYEGDAFVVEVDDAVFQMVVPAGCSPGEVIYMDIREGAGYPAGDLTTKQRSGSRPASGVRKVAKDILPEEEHEAPEVEGRGNVEVDASLTESLTEEALIASGPDGPAEMERQPSRSPSMASRPSRLSSRSSRSHQSVHVQVPDGVKPGEKFFVVVDDMEYEVWAPEGSSPGEMVAMDVYKDPVESQKALTASRESGKSRRKGTNTSEPESVATDGSLVYVQIPEGSGPGETFFTDVNGFEYEILVPSTCQSGDLIYLEVPAKRTMGKFVVPENSPAALPYDAPSIFTALSDPFSDTSRSDHLADIRVPTGVHAGQTFVVIIDGVEFEVPVPEGYGAGDLMSLQLPSKGISPDPVTAAGLEEVRAELEQVRAELKEVRESRFNQSGLSRDSQRFEERFEDDNRFLHESKSSGDSNFIQIQIPLDCYAGDAFVVEVDEAEFRMVVPAGCSPGEVIYMDMREGAGYPAGDLTTKQRSGSRPASGVRKVAKDILREEEHETEALLARSSISETQETAEIVIPEEQEVEEVEDVEEIEGGRGNVVGASIEEILAISADGPKNLGTLSRGGPSGPSGVPIDVAALVEMEMHSRLPSASRSRPSSRRSSGSHTSRTSVHVQVPEGVYPGEKFFVVVDDMEYEVVAPEGSAPGEMVAMDFCRDPVEGSKVLRPSQDSDKSERKIDSVATDVGKAPGEGQKVFTVAKQSATSERKDTNTSEVDSAATDGDLVYVQVAEICIPGETFFTEINGVEYEILVPSTCQSGDLIYLKVPAKRTTGKLVVPEKSPAALPYDAPSFSTDPLSDTGPGLADVRVPSGVHAGQTFVVIIDGEEFEVPVPEGYGAGDLMSLQLPSKGISPPVTGVEGVRSELEQAQFTKSLEEVRAELEQVQFSTQGLEELRAELERVRAELKEVRETGLKESVFGERKRLEDDGRFLNGSTTSETSNIIEIQIPLDCYEGDAFIVEVDEAEFRMVVPVGCFPGELIYMDMREGASYSAAQLTKQQRNSSRPASGVRKVAKDMPEEDSHETESLLARSSISETQETLEIVIPEDCYPGDIFVIEVKGAELELLVPDGCQPGELIYVDLPSEEGSRASAASESIRRDKAKPLSAGLDVRAELAQVQYCTKGLEELRAELEELRAELAEVRESRYYSESSSGGSNIHTARSRLSESQETLEIVIPEDCHPGDTFVVKVKGTELELSAPDGCQPGERLSLYLPREGQILEFELVKMQGESCLPLGSVELEWDRFIESRHDSLSLTGTDKFLRIELENPATVEEHGAPPLAPLAPLAAAEGGGPGLEAERDRMAVQLAAEITRMEAQERQRMKEEEERSKTVEAAIAEAEAQERQRMKEEEERIKTVEAAIAEAEAQERQRMKEEEERSKTVEAAIAEAEAERQREEELRLAAIEEAERLRREEEEREAAKEAAKKAKEEAERQRLEFLKQQAIEEAERAVREEEARIKREEAERKGKIVISVTVLNDETEELMAKASLRLGCKVQELGQACVREARLSVAPAIFSEPTPEPKMVRGKMELRERFPLPPDDTLLEAGVENNAVLRAKISSAVITASKDCTARIWNAETGSCQLVLEGHNAAVCSACISPDCRYVATSSEDSSARLWYVDSGRCARVLQDHKEAVYSASFSPDSKQVVTASEDGTAKIWVVKTGLCKLTLKGHNFAVLWAAFAPDGRSVTTTSSDGTLKIWNAKTGVCDRTLLGQKPVYLASFATDGSTFVTASGDDTAKICDLVTGESKIVLSGHESLVLGASYAPSCPQAEQQAEQQKDENG